MENLSCPKCKGELKPVYRNAYKEANGYVTIEGAVAVPSEWLCETCKVLLLIKEVGKLC